VFDGVLERLRIGQLPSQASVNTGVPGKAHRRSSFTILLWRISVERSRKYLYGMVHVANSSAYHRTSM
jgi:hypothetical protein